MPAVKPMNERGGYQVGRQMGKQSTN